MQFIEFIVLILFSSYVLETGKVTVLRYVTETVIKILKNRRRNDLIIKKDPREQFWDFDALYGNLFDTWLAEIERTISSIPY